VHFTFLKEFNPYLGMRQIQKKITNEIVASSEKRTSSASESGEAFLESDDESGDWGRRFCHLGNLVVFRGV